MSLSRSLHTVAVLICLLALCASAAPTVAAGPPQMRALWVDAFNSGIKSPSQVAQLVADARRGGFNALVVQVRRRGDAYYLSGVEPRGQDAALDPAPYDPLGTLLSEAHGAGIEVHAWIATLCMWKDSLGTPSSPEHLYWQHGPGVQGSDNWVALGSRGETGISGDTWLDPGHPAVVGYSAAVVGDLLSRYPALDGLHLDLVRYASPSFGYNPVSVARFNERYGRSGSPDPNDPQWGQWRREQVTGLVRRIYLTAAQVAPHVRVSVAAIAIGKAPSQLGGWERSDPYSARLQDWRGWLEQGIVDTVLVMNYDREGDANQRSWYRAWVNWETTQAAGRAVVVGHGAWLNSVSGTLDQIQHALNAGASGVAAYAYSDLTSDSSSHGELLDALKGGPFVTPAAMPSMPWKSNYGTLTGELSLLRGLPSGDSLPIMLSGPTPRLLRSDGAGWFGAVDLQPGRYLAITLLPGNQKAVGEAEVRAGEVATIVWRTQ